MMSIEVLLKILMRFWIVKNIVNSFTILKI